MVDTGCAWPMAVPKVYVDALVRVGLATRAGASSTTFADGSTHDVGIIMIGAINVDGRVLHDVEASVSPSNEAPVLLGLGVLNRLGPYTITDGKLVFTGEQPA
jgi:predicted aspartyl protease